MLSSRKPAKPDTINKVILVKSCVFQPKSNLNYDSFYWMCAADFVRIDKANIMKYFPSGFSNEGEITFVGKARTLLKSSDKITDQIGAVKRSTRKLEICYSNKIFSIDTFSILGFNQTKSFYWHTCNDVIQNMPKNALKLGVDTLAQKVLYAGRATVNKYTHLIGHLAGTSGKVNQELMVSVDNEMIKCKKFEILCLRPSPASLKHLCRIKIRTIIGHENSKMENLNILLDDSLIKYIKYSSELKINQQLKSGESLISSNGLYRLSLEKNGNLIYYINENRDFLFLYDNVECVWFNDLRVIVCFRDFTSKSFLSNLDNFNILFDDSRLKVFDDGAIKIISPHHKVSLIK